MQLSLQILGASSAIPLSGRNPTSQFLTLASRQFLIDCGEGCQLQLRRNKVGFGRIKHILISHLHGDHFYGLLPLLNTLHLLDRYSELHLYGPPELEQGLKDMLCLSRASLRYPIVFHALNMKARELIYDDDKVSVHSFPLKHSIACCGFLFQEKIRPRKINVDAIKKYGVSKFELNAIKMGADWQQEDGSIVKNEELTSSGGEPISYAYCTDTLPLPDLKERLGLSPTLLYHEATFANDQIQRAKKTKHSTATQAAQVAIDVEAKHLLLGHFSARYTRFDALLDEAKTVFKNSYLAQENGTTQIDAKGKFTQVTPNK